MSNHRQGSEEGKGFGVRLAKKGSMGKRCEQKPRGQVEQASMPLLRMKPKKQKLELTGLPPLEKNLFICTIIELIWEMK